MTPPKHPPRSLRTYRHICTIAVLGLLGCTDDRVLESADIGESSGNPISGSTTTDATTTSGGLESTGATATTSTATIGTTGADETTDDTSTGVLFVAEPDVGPRFECSTFFQDCPPGQKCTAWADDGSNTWNDQRCAPIADDPVGPGEPCRVQDYVASGLDDCALGSICFEIDPKTLEGVCFPFCVGSESMPICEDPDRQCHLGADGVINLCTPVCDPLAQDCAADEACYPVAERWLCGLDGSGDAGAYGDPCEFINACDPGLMCLGADALPPGLPCEGAVGCCAEVCDLTDPAGDLQCIGAADGVICQPWYLEGEAPPGYEAVGACALPL